MRTLLIVTAALMFAPAAQAQVGPRRPPVYGPGYRPNLSPYLNLLRGGDPSSNYFLGTLPEFQRRSNAATFRQAIADLDAITAPKPEEYEEDLTPVQSGTRPYVNTTGGYFNNTGGYFLPATNNRAGGAPGQGVGPSPRQR